jgi:formylglycine-generating enzyme required for sulfatase activity
MVHLPLLDHPPILRDAALGLGAAHAKEMVHRDVKPGNIMVNREGVVKVADLGLVKHLGGEWTLLTATVDRAGTPGYMPPEQIERPDEIGPATDVWALGSVAWFLLVGRHGISREAAVTQTCLRPYPDIRDEIPTVPAAVADLITRATQQEIATRYRDGNAMARAIDEVIRELYGLGQHAPSGRRIQTAASSVEKTAASSVGTPKVPASPGVPETRAPSWAAVLTERPDPAVITDADGRRRMEATGLPWHVMDRFDIEYLLIPPGTYRRGSLESEEGSESDERPQHPVTLTKPFYLGRYEVTQGQWTHVMGSNPSFFSHGVRNRLPVEDVSHIMIAGEDGRGGGNTFLGRTGCRLPTEAEWEYACRAGTTTPFSFDQTITTDQANYGQRMAPVGSYPANSWGLHDMHGNVWEWCSDWYAEDAYAACRNGARDPVGPSVGSLRVLRGGSWYFNPVYLRSASRRGVTPSFVYGYLGFRVARAP